MDGLNHACEIKSAYYTLSQFQQEQGHHFELGVDHFPAPNVSCLAGAALSVRVIAGISNGIRRPVRGRSGIQPPPPKPPPVCTGATTVPLARLCCPTCSVATDRVIAPRRDDSLTVPFVRYLAISTMPLRPFSCSSVVSDPRSFSNRDHQLQRCVG